MLEARRCRPATAADLYKWQFSVPTVQWCAIRRADDFDGVIPRGPSTSWAICWRSSLTASHGPVPPLIGMVRRSIVDAAVTCYRCLELPP